MAVATLSPWPSTPAALANARNCLDEAIGVTDESTLDRLGSTAAALVERCAPNAPQVVKNEAVVRTAGWLVDQPAAAISSQTLGPMTTATEPARQSALRHSGAMALLSPWKVRRAGSIA